jgi:hypothetical protein
MSDVFDGYERQYCELSASLSKKCSSAISLDGGKIVTLIFSKMWYFSYSGIALPSLRFEITNSGLAYECNNVRIRDILVCVFDAEYCAI